MKICIFETQHFEGAYPVIRLFDIPGNQITVITSRESYPRFEELFRENLQRFTWIVLPSKKSQFFYQFYRNLKKIRPDILYLNTVSNNHILYAFILSLLNLNRVILTVHDINCLFESRSAWNFRKAIIHRGKRWLIRKIDAFNVVSDTMIDYLKTKTNKNVIQVPGGVFEERFSRQSINKEIRLVVPGSLDKKRRNYEQVFELAFLADNYQLPLTIILLGGYSDEFGKSIVNRARQSNNNFCKIHFYELPVVDQFEFDKQLDNCHFVFIPSVIHTHICEDIPETYGITKSSGNVFDVIKHAKPFIIPRALTISSDLENSCFKYDSLENIIGFLSIFVNSPVEYQSWQKKALENSRQFSAENIRQKNLSLFG
jgi:hypothetical protein